MKRIELKTVPGDYPVDYKQVLTDVIRRPLDPQKGADIPEMRQSIRVLDALDASNGVLELEDSDYLHLKQKLDNMQWNVIDARIVALVDEVTSAGA